MFKERRYRNWVQSDDLISFEVKEKETDLFILAEKNLEKQVRESILSARSELERYIEKRPDFHAALEPVFVEDSAPAIVKMMAGTAMLVGVGPMASVAGAVAQIVGMDIAAFSDEIVIENGGDIFIKTARKRIVGIYAGERSPFTGHLAIEVGPAPQGIGVCTSSGTVSHSLSFGMADAALIIARDAALADAAATVAGNAVRTPFDIESGLERVRSIEGVSGALILVGDKMGSWGDIRLT